jgi:hypothetical protein
MRSIESARVRQMSRVYQQNFIGCATSPMDDVGSYACIFTRFINKPTCKQNSDPIIIR